MSQITEFADGFTVTEMDEPTRTGKGFGDRGSINRSSTDITGHAYDRAIKDRAELLDVRKRTADEVMSGTDVETVSYGDYTYVLPRTAVKIIREGLDQKRTTQK